MPVVIYFKIINETLRLYREGRFIEAYDLVTAAEEVTAGNPAQVLNFRHSIAGKLGDRVLAISLMRTAIVEKGY